MNMWYNSLERLWLVMVVIALLLVSVRASAQEILASQVDFHFQNQTLTSVFSKIEMETGAQFSYRIDIIPKDITINAEYQNDLLINVLNSILKGTGLTYETIGNQIILSLIPPKQDYTLNGKIKSKENGELLIGATIIVKETGDGVVANNYGFYSITLPEGRYNLIVKSLGFKHVNARIDIRRDLIVDFDLIEDVNELKSVTITKSRDGGNYYIREHRTGIIKLNSNTIKKIPSLFGEFDPMRAAQRLPGVGIANEGNTGFFVRGGDGDQNLILMDEAVVYNPNHVLGFFSIFNANAINEMQLFKGNIPASYGGRLSSVLEIRLKEGNTKQQRLSGGVGTLSTRLTFEQPFADGKGSTIIAVRRSYLDLFFFSIPKIGFNENRFNFSDINIKSSFRINDRNKLTLSGYWGEDRTGYEDLYETRWGNQILSLQWSHMYSPKLVSYLTLYTSNFNTRNSNNQFPSLSYSQRYGINDFSIKQDFNYFPDNRLQVDFGAQIIAHRFNIGRVTPGENSVLQAQQGSPQRALESAAYLSIEHEISNRFSLNYGLRVSRFDNFGPSSVFLYDRPDVPSQYISEDNIIGEVEIQQGIYNTYQGLEPRLSARYIVNKTGSIKLAYARTRQYISQLQSEITPAPSDMWAPANTYIPPKISDQASLGYYMHFMGSTYTASVEAYFKKTQNILEFKPLANFLLNEHLETEILLGDGTAYGLEFFLRKQRGIATGWISYTFGRSLREVPGINQGAIFPSSFDRKHQFSFVLSYQPHPRVNLSANWVYASGIAYTFPVGKYQINGIAVPYYTERNSFRLPPNHHLDISATFYRKKDEENKNQSSFNFSIYNLYNRQNPFAYVFRQNEQSPDQSEVVKLYFFTIVPSFTYLFQF